MTTAARATNDTCVAGWHSCFTLVFYNKNRKNSRECPISGTFYADGIGVFFVRVGDISGRITHVFSKCQ